MKFLARRTIAICIAAGALALGGALSPAAAQSTSGCVVDGQVAGYISEALASGSITSAEAQAARCEPTLMLASASTGTTVTSTTRPNQTVVSSSRAGAAVACTDRAKITYSKNAFGMVLVWHKTLVEWCWNSRMIITSGRSYSQYDTPGFCWGYDGAAETTYLGGKGYGYWDVTRGSRFSCGVGGLALHRTLYANLRVRGGGGAS